MNGRLVGVLVGVGALVALAACGGDVRPTTEEFIRDVQERRLGAFNDGLRGVCESRSFSRIVGSAADDVCECALRVAREQLTDDELVTAITDDLPLPKAVEERAAEVCLRSSEN